MANWNYRNNKAANMNSGRNEEIMDRENQQMTQNLADKVSRLKNIAFDIETETKDSNSYLTGMGMDMDGSTGLLSGTMKRMDHMIGSGKGNRKLMCYIILGLVVAFLIFYFIISRFTAS
ncbi:hypothetical protein CAPTEDRAFT_190867 [Capitella teleta]|uniref:t-SNARE coiled-coil homology domain-containing protein n=1 Tax=Capitella teleta TaxID=283909 RepID=R7VH94_CAPTE|nr:hypothetical protein CAPTEDRAFT_190867 [Capitella teleta]|eukprot:ELU17952.1 hypothetical protein CAPTEDRAFT_190867 [Capitella teleta]